MRRWKERKRETYEEKEMVSGKKTTGQQWGRKEEGKQKDRKQQRQGLGDPEQEWVFLSSIHLCLEANSWIKHRGNDLPKWQQGTGQNEAHSSLQASTGSADWEGI